MIDAAALLVGGSFAAAVVGAIAVLAGEWWIYNS